LRISLGREDTHIGQVQRHLNEVVHSDAPSEPAPPSSYKHAPSLYHTRLWPFDDRATPTDDFRHYPCGEFLEVGKWTKSSYEDIKTAAYFGARLFTFGCNTLFEVTDQPPDGLRFCYKHHHG
jgi:hypothetical protein